MQYVLICHRCGRDVIVADVCPLCGGTYCPEECIIDHVKGIELRRIEREIIAERYTQEGQGFLLPIEGESAAGSYREGAEGTRNKKRRRR